MKYYLVSLHAQQPRFYTAQGMLVAVDLEYSTKKTYKELDADGRVIESHFESNNAVSGQVWMCCSIERAVDKLASLGIYPFESKKSAKEFAIKNQLVGFKYLPVHTSAIVRDSD